MFLKDMEDLILRVKQKINPDKPLFVFSEESGSQYLVDILSALRGPDFALFHRVDIDRAIAYGSEVMGGGTHGEAEIDKCRRAKSLFGIETYEFTADHLKWLTTARIRYLVCPTYRGAVNPTRLSSKAMTLRDELLKVGSYHFRSHYQGAVTAIATIFDYDLWRELPYIRGNRI
jgi:hypothetical protein